MIEIIRFLSAIIVGYLLGSIPFGVLIGRRQAGIDIRNYGSGKMGATNVLRTAGKKAALAVCLLDLSKGILAVILAGLIVRNDYLIVDTLGLGILITPVMAALAAVVGHIWPVFCRFRGGRGVATFFGGLIALYPIAALFGGQLVIIGAGLTGFASIGSIVGVVGSYAILIPLTIINGYPILLLVYALVGAVLIIVMHRDNIARLLAGKERKIWDKSHKEDSSKPT